VDKFVLFAEDDLIQAKVLSAVCKNLALPASGFSIVSSGAEAIAYFKKAQSPDSPVRKPDIVITDLKMPEVDGLDLLKWIRESAEFKDTPVVILTGAFDPGIQKMAAALGCDGFFEKPAGLAKMGETIKKALAVRS
jgi:CheY-like chemotaxis protein